MHESGDAAPAQLGHQSVGRSLLIVCCGLSVAIFIGVAEGGALLMISLGTTILFFPVMTTWPGHDIVIVPAS